MTHQSWLYPKHAGKITLPRLRQNLLVFDKKSVLSIWTYFDFFLPPYFIIFKEAGFLSCTGSVQRREQVLSAGFWTVLGGFFFCVNETALRSYSRNVLFVLLLFFFVLHLKSFTRRMFSEHAFVTWKGGWGVGGG